MKPELKPLVREPTARHPRRLDLPGRQLELVAVDVERVVAGGFPMALARSTANARSRWFDDYVTLTLERDVREISRVRQGDLLLMQGNLIADTMAIMASLDPIMGGVDK